jgi:DNA-binding NarL/FixJ family response regulator
LTRTRALNETLRLARSAVEVRARSSSRRFPGPPEERAIRVLSTGESLLSPFITRRLIEDVATRPRTPSGPPPEIADLTDREREVLILVAHGLSNAEIAERIVVSIGTVKTHVARLLMKLGLRDRVQAVVLAYESGLVTPGEQRPGPPG